MLILDMVSYYDFYSPYGDIMKYVIASPSKKMQQKWIYNKMCSESM